MTPPPDFTPLAETMGIETVAEGAETYVCRMPVAPNRQPFGLLAGGASAMLAESTASRAAVLHAAQFGKIAVGVELNASHHASAREGWVIATARAAHLGKTSASYEVVIETESGRRLCTARALCLLIERPSK